MSALPQQRVFNYPNRLARQNRQPQGVADFVLIDPYKFLEYANLERLFDKLPTGLPMAKDKAEPCNRYYHKWQVQEFSHFTPNHKKYIHSLIFDLDPSANDFNFMAWSDQGLPPPNIIISNPHKQNSCQYIYLLQYPVYTSKVHIKKWLDDIYVCMRDLLNADKFFNRTRSKNPFSPEHDTYVSGAEPYDLATLSDCAFIRRHENLLIQGKCGCGKSFLACALGRQACMLGYRTAYLNMNSFVEKVALSKLDGTFLKMITSLEKNELIILDDFGLQPMDTNTRLALLQILEERYERKSVIIASQLPINKWYDYIGDPTLADAILDRLVSNANKIELKGESMRHKKKK